MECLKHWEDSYRTAVIGPGSKPANTGPDSSRWPKGKADRMGILHPKVLVLVLTVTVYSKAPRERLVWLPKKMKLLQIRQRLSLEPVAGLEAVEAFAVVSASAPECVFVPEQPFAVVRGPLSVVAR